MPSQTIPYFHSFSKQILIRKILQPDGAKARYGVSDVDGGDKKAKGYNIHTEALVEAIGERAQIARSVLGEVVALVASLGGYLGRKPDGPPGPKAVWIGLQRLRDIVIAIDALQSLGERFI